jgi:hypothetical protein
MLPMSRTCSRNNALGDLRVLLAILACSTGSRQGQVTVPPSIPRHPALFCVTNKLSCSHYELRRFSSLALVFVCVRLACSRVCLTLLPTLLSGKLIKGLCMRRSIPHRVRLPYCQRQCFCSAPRFEPMLKGKLFIVIAISQGVDPHLILGILGTLSTKQAYTDLPSATPPDSAPILRPFFRLSLRGGILRKFTIEVFHFNSSQSNPV